MVLVIPISGVSDGCLRNDIGVTRLGAFGRLQTWGIDIAGAAASGGICAIALVTDGAFSCDTAINIGIGVMSYVASTSATSRVYVLGHVERR